MSPPVVQDNTNLMVVQEHMTAAANSAPTAVPSKHLTVDIPSDTNDGSNTLLTSDKSTDADVSMAPAEDVNRMSPLFGSNSNSNMGINSSNNVNAGTASSVNGLSISTGLEAGDEADFNMILEGNVPEAIPTDGDNNAEEGSGEDKVLAPPTPVRRRMAQINKKIMEEEILQRSSDVSVHSDEGRRSVNEGSREDLPRGVVPESARASMLARDSASNRDRSRSRERESRTSELSAAQLAAKAYEGKYGSSGKGDTKGGKKIDFFAKGKGRETALYTDLLTRGVIGKPVNFKGAQIENVFLGKKGVPGSIPENSPFWKGFKAGMKGKGGKGTKGKGKYGKEGKGGPWDAPKGSIDSWGTRNSDFTSSLVARTSNASTSSAGLEDWVNEAVLESLGLGSDAATASASSAAAAASSASSNFDINALLGVTDFGTSTSSTANVTSSHSMDASITSALASAVGDPTISDSAVAQLSQLLLNTNASSPPTAPVIAPPPPPQYTQHPALPQYNHTAINSLVHLHGICPPPPPEPPRHPIGGGSWSAFDAQQLLGLAPAAPAVPAPPVVHAPPKSNTDELIALLTASSAGSASSAGGSVGSHGHIIPPPPAPAPPAASSSSSGGSYSEDDWSRWLTDSSATNASNSSAVSNADMINNLLGMNTKTTTASAAPSIHSAFNATKSHIVPPPPAPQPPAAAGGSGDWSWADGLFS